MADERSAALTSLEVGIASEQPLLYVVGWEEQRIEQELGRLSRRHYGDRRPLLVWSATRGLCADGEPIAGADSAVEALRYVSDSKRDAIYYFKDLPAYLKSGDTVTRVLRDIADELLRRNTIVCLSYPELHLPVELKKSVYVIDMPPPTEDELADYIGRALDRLNARDKVGKDWIYRSAQAMRGLELIEVRRLMRRLVQERRFTFQTALLSINETKEQSMLKESCLRMVTTDERVDRIGGLTALKKWLDDRQPLFSQSAHESHLPRPRGLLLMGVSGCGKSMAAKAIALAWGVQLVRLDMNLVFSGQYGNPENAFFQATRTAERMAPCVVWIDEIENSLGFDVIGKGGGNPNVFSGFLTWMQEKPAGVFIVATANRIEELPAEVIRKGRFDQVFFLDLPTAAERQEIVRIHIAQQGGAPGQFDLDLLAFVTKEWTGAEIATAVQAARIEAFRHQKQFTTRDIVRHTENMVPLSKTMREQVNRLREWSHTRAVNASGLPTDRAPD
jgi:ATP-dependent 26S proteasome regulatory subunit